MSEAPGIDVTDGAPAQPTAPDVEAMPPAEADLMMQAQMAAAAKRALSDYVIENDGDMPALEQAAARVWESLLDRA